MAGKPRKIPSYCRHKASGQAVVRIAGKDHYLGQFGSPESYEEYQRIIAEKFPNGQPSLLGNLTSHTSQSDLTIVELIAVYWEFAEGYYVKNGEPTSELSSLRSAFRPLKELYGSVRVVDFGPVALDAVRNRMIKSGITRKRINQHLSRIRRMFKWGVSKELIPLSSYQALATISGLRKGRSTAKESKPINPVEFETVEKTLPLLSRQIQVMVRLQYLLGCRPGEIIILRPRDVICHDREVWEFVPESHKAEHHNRQRRIFVGKQAQDILLPWLDRSSESFCFSPAEARREFDAERRATRVTPHTPSSRKRRRKSKPKKRPGERYTTQSYGAAIRKACHKANVTHWSPNQLRHPRASVCPEIAVGLTGLLF